MHERFNRKATMYELDNDEMVVCDVKRHHFGLVVLYISSLIGALSIAFLVIYILPQIFDEDGKITSISFLIAGLVSILLFASMLIATIIYKENRLTVTTKDITQMLQQSIFSKKTSQLSLANVEDVTVEQNGVFPTLFNYGTLKVETAGEQANFHFIYCPNPNAVAHAILQAREQYLSANPGQSEEELRQKGRFSPPSL